MMRACAVTAVVALAAQATAQLYTVTGNGTDGQPWEFQLGGNNRLGVWVLFQISEYTNSGDMASYEYFSPTRADVEGYVQASPATRQKIASKLKFRFEEAVDYCRTVHNASLVSIRNRQERDFVISMMPNTRHGFWLGLQRNSIVADNAPGEYSHFLDGTPVTYYSWAAGEPTMERGEQCVYQGINNQNPSEWVDADCFTLKRRAVCKRPVSMPDITATATATQAPRTRGTPSIDQTAPPQDDYGACYVADGVPNEQQSRVSNTDQNYIIRNYTGNLGVDPALLHFAEPYCCFKYVSFPKQTFADAEAMCQAWGNSMPSDGGEGHLARVVDPAMNMFLYRMKIDAAGVHSNDIPWIGATVRNGHIDWVDRRQFDGITAQDGWEPWFDGQPDGSPGDQQCVMMGSRITGQTQYTTDQSHWSDSNCTRRQQYFCQYCSISTHTDSPTHSPTISPTALPSTSPTSSPTAIPTAMPTMNPSSMPTMIPTAFPTTRPSCAPSPGPTRSPTASPSLSPTADRSVCAANGFSVYTGPDGSGLASTDSFCCYKHISPKAKERLTFAKAQEKCQTLGARISASAGQQVFGVGSLAAPLGPHMNQWLATSLYTSAAPNTEDRSWIAATRDATAPGNISWLSNQTNMWANQYPWADGEPSIFGAPISRTDPGPEEDCVAMGDGTVNGMERWNDANCSSKRQAFCQYCYNPPPVEITPEMPEITTEGPDYDCGNPLTDPPTEVHVTLPATTTTTEAPSSQPTAEPSSSMPTEMPTIDQGLCDGTDGWTTFPGSLDELGYQGRRSAQGFCCYKYFSDSSTGRYDRLSHAQAERMCQSEAASHPGEGHLAFAVSRQVNDWLFEEVRSSIPGSSQDKSWIAGVVSRSANGTYYVNPGAASIGGTGSGPQAFVGTTASGQPDYPWYLNEPSEFINVGAAATAGENTESCVSMGKGNLQGQAPNLWNDAVCSKSRPYFCQYCYTPPDPFTSSPSFSSPSVSPTLFPSVNPTAFPSTSPSVSPTNGPTVSPTSGPTSNAPTVAPSFSPSISPTISPTVLTECSESHSASTILSLKPRYGERWAQTCWGVPRNDPIWLCDCYLTMTPAEQASVFPNQCRVVALSADMSAINAITDLLDYNSTSRRSGTCPGAIQPMERTVCSDVRCSNDCRYVSNGGAIPDGGPSCGWSSRKNKCREGGTTKTRELDRGECSVLLSHARCEQFTCGRDCYANRGHQDQVGAVGCGWSSKKFKCIYGGVTRPDEMNAGYCNA